MDFFNKNKILNNTGMPPNVQKLLQKYGDSKIRYIKINRQPVQSGLTKMLNLFSKGGNNFEKELKKQPYDTLYHLQMQFATDKGRVVLEKNERVNMAERPIEVETMQIPFPEDLTINQIYNNALDAVGPDKFYKYNASSNNCQNFVLYLLQNSGLATPEAIAFTKQDTTSLFKNDPNLRKIANSTTTLGAKFNVLFQGGEIDNEDDTEVLPMPKLVRNKKINPWIAHVKQYAREHNCTYREALKLSKDSYVRL